jgi:hypothetical protein
MVGFMTENEGSHPEEYGSEPEIIIDEKRQKLHERIMRAFNAVPNYEGFTTKEIANKHEMPEPRGRWHLEKY